MPSSNVYLLNARHIDTQFRTIERVGQGVSRVNGDAESCKKSSKVSSEQAEGGGGHHWCGPLNTNVRQGGPYNKYCDGACFLAPPFPPPLPISAPSSSSTLIKNSYILISRGCVVPRVATDAPGFSSPFLLRVFAIRRKRKKRESEATREQTFRPSLRWTEAFSKRSTRLVACWSRSSRSRTRDIEVSDLTVRSILGHVPAYSTVKLLEDHVTSGSLNVSGQTVIKFRRHMYLAILMFNTLV